MRKWIPLLLAGIAVLISIALMSRLPATMIIHWDIQGRPNGWAPRWLATTILPVLMLALTGLFHLLPRFDSLGHNIEKFRPEYELIIAAIVTMILAMHVSMLCVALGYRLDIMRITLVLTGLLFATVGNVVPRLRRNHIAGFRTASTLSSDEVWARTHRVGGALLMATGILIALSAFAPLSWAVPLVVALSLAMAISIVVYSARVKREIQSPRPS